MSGKIYVLQWSLPNYGVSVHETRSEADLAAVAALAQHVADHNMGFDTGDPLYWHRIEEVTAENWARRAFDLYEQYDYGKSRLRIQVTEVNVPEWLKQPPVN